MSRTIRIGQTFTVTLPGNPTTGYQWTYSISRPDVVSMRGSYVPPSIDIPGRGGTYTFYGRGMSRGTTYITFYYGREWEDQPIEMKTYTIRVV